MKNFNELAINYKYDQSSKNYSELYNALKRPLTSFIYSIVKDTDVASDLWQNVAIKIYQKIDSFNENFSFTTWAYTIARNESFMALKSKHQKNRISLSTNECGIEAKGEGGVSLLDMVDYSADFSEFDSPDSSIDDQHSDTLEIISTMDQKFGEYLYKKYVKGLKEQEIAEDLNVSKSTVKNRLYHGRKKVQKIYESLHASN